jgi:two-component system response regulator HydG
VAATNQNLETLTREKKFRPDLYFRLNVVRLDLPPLRERSEDIPALAEHILDELSEGQAEPVRRLESDVVRRLQRHSWPGNVRELRNMLESILVYSSARSISLADVPVHIRRTLCSQTPRADERSKILSALNSADWNRSKASELLHCSRMTLYRQMIKHSITDGEV